jgi:uncharacterized protein
MKRVVWQGADEPRMEIAYVDPGWDGRRADGTQIGVEYELRYELDGDVLRLEIVEGDAATIELGDADFFDLGYSPLFNSLPVLRDGLLVPGPPRDYAMRWVDVPSLAASRVEQRYEPLADRVVRYSAGTFTADIRFDADGLVVDYPGLAHRLLGKSP